MTDHAITGKTLIDWGYGPSKWFGQAVAAAEAVRRNGGDVAAQRAAVEAFKPGPALPLRANGSVGFHRNIRAEHPDEVGNVAAVEAHMTELMRVPTIVAGAIMPDACPAGMALGTIPVGGVVATRNAIHPGFHSADICCSMAVSVFKGEVDPTAILDAGMILSHFGPGGRPREMQIRPADALLERFERNPFLSRGVSDAIEHHGSQGDGNHFFYVGRVASSGAIALVTHHGSRKPGAMLYKHSMVAAERKRRDIAPDVAPHYAWIVADSQEGEDYWAALQTIRAWTKSNHFAVHDLVAAHLGMTVADRFWNEHNFAFQKSDGLFYYGKGATPAWDGFAADSNGLTLIPLNMAEPILIAKGRDAANGLGFAPHGAGRNFSRSAYMRGFAGMAEADIVREQTRGIDARFFCGIPDISELPLAYKNAATVRAQIAEYGLADVVDTIEPVGSIMAGDWQRNAPWRTKRDAKRIARGADSQAEAE